MEPKIFATRTGSCSNCPVAGSRTSVGCMSLGHRATKFVADFSCLLSDLDVAERSLGRSCDIVKKNGVVKQGGQDGVHECVFLLGN